MYLIFALLSGLIGTAFSVLIRLELSGPGVQYIADNQLYNSIITAHAIVMIFFMVKVYEKMSNIKSESLSANTDNDFDLMIGNDDNGHNNDHEDNKNFNHKYVKVFIKDPYNNRDAILKITKKQKGVYV
ncbi:MAG: cbb3-type cytochrome c oxidase subunit I [Rickettsia endosymbiont of Ixodes persulcatus]|nr:cbb3-type cytochrome c oxidase subunit I [Rickettsia endosymbiont of Ixodes persulcatus]